MYPFKTNKKVYVVNSNEDSIQNILELSIVEDKLQMFKWSDQFYGKVNRNKAIFQLGHSPVRNPWKPIVTLSWQSKNGMTEIISYFSLDKIIYLSLLTIPIIGLYLSITLKIVTPFFVSSISYLFVLFVLNYFPYSISKSRTSKLLEDLIKKIP